MPAKDRDKDVPEAFTNAITIPKTGLISDKGPNWMTRGFQSELATMSFDFDDYDSPFVTAGTVSDLKDQLQLQEEILQLKRERTQLIAELAQEKNEAKRREIENREEKLGEKQRSREQISPLKNSVSEEALSALENDPHLLEEFSKVEPHESCILIVDVRRSTDLMLYARNATLFALFIIKLCSDLSNFVKKNHGIFDKFLGDGIIAYFPKFFSGEDYVYFALKAANECQKHFRKCYSDYRKHMNLVKADVGLGIGIDCGPTNIVTIGNIEIEIVGDAVVYASRLCSEASPGSTLINQRAYEIASSKYRKESTWKEVEKEIKEGPCIVHELKSFRSAKNWAPKPSWSHKEK